MKTYNCVEIKLLSFLDSASNGVSGYIIPWERLPFPLEFKNVSSPEAVCTLWKTDKPITSEGNQVLKDRR
jgi:hypothetical protein